MGFDVTESDRLHGRVREIAGAGAPLSDAAFEALLGEIVRFQAAHVTVAERVYRDGGPPLALPGVPVDAFKLRRVAAHPSTRDARVFRTSGTTQGARGEHSLRTLETYDRVALAWAKAMLWPFAVRPRIVAATPSSIALPDSSLSYMIDLFGRTFGERISHHVSSDGVDVAGLGGALREAADEDRPVLLVGTSFAFVHALDRDLPAITLPPGSRVMITGGTKGKSREVVEIDLRAALAARLGLVPDAIVGEYGMTELTSQLYEAPNHDGISYRPPPWMRVIATDPVTGTNLPDGSEGILKLCDLANVDSAAIVQTLDLGCVRDGRVELRGRLPGSEARGCSLIIEELAEWT